MGSNKHKILCYFHEFRMLVVFRSDIITKLRIVRKSTNPSKNIKENRTDNIFYIFICDTAARGGHEVSNAGLLFLLLLISFEALNSI